MLRHRLLLSFEAEANGVTPDQVIRGTAGTRPRRLSMRLADVTVPCRGAIRGAGGPDRAALSRPAVAPGAPRRALSALAGPNKSNFRGRGIEFEEVRSYQPGDDIRGIDWRVTARTGSAHTKLFREERERPVLVAVDQRSSMFFGSSHCFKSVLAAQLAGLLAWSALEAGDRVAGWSSTAPSTARSAPAQQPHGAGAVVAIWPTTTAPCRWPRPTARISPPSWPTCGASCGPAAACSSSAIFAAPARSTPASSCSSCPSTSDYRHRLQRPAGSGPARRPVATPSPTAGAQRTGHRRPGPAQAYRARRAAARTAVDGTAAPGHSPAAGQHPPGPIQRAATRLRETRAGEPAGSAGQPAPAAGTAAHRLVAAGPGLVAAGGLVRWLLALAVLAWWLLRRRRANAYRRQALAQAGAIAAAVPAAAGQPALAGRYQCAVKGVAWWPTPARRGRQQREAWLALLNAPLKPDEQFPADFVAAAYRKDAPAVDASGCSAVPRAGSGATRWPDDRVDLALDAGAGALPWLVRRLAPVASAARSPPCAPRFTPTGSNWAPARAPAAAAAAPCRCCRCG